MKKILIINTAYKEKGGEDTNIVDEINFLKDNYEVEYLEYKNSDNIKASDILAFFTSSNIKSNKILKSKINEFKPDLIYVHNTWYRANLGIFKILRDTNAKVFIKLHNFRFFCTRTLFASKHLKNSEFCHMCNLNKGKSLFNKYFKDSYIKSIFVIIYGRRYFQILKGYGFNLLVMTEFQKNFLKSLEFNPKRIKIYKNPTLLNQQAHYKVNSGYLVYAGRVTEEKGISELLEAWRKSKVKNLTLKIIGDGELLKLHSLNIKNHNVEFLGELSHKKTLEIIKNSRGVLTATKMYEAQPRLLCEASISGVPSLFPEFGGMSEFFPKDYKFKFEQFNYEDLSEKIEMFNDKRLLEETSESLINYSKILFDKETNQNSFEEVVY